MSGNSVLEKLAARVSRARRRILLAEADEMLRQPVYYGGVPGREGACGHGALTKSQIPSTKSQTNSCLPCLPAPACR